MAASNTGSFASAIASLYPSTAEGITARYGSILGKETVHQRGATFQVSAPKHLLDTLDAVRTRGDELAKLLLQETVSRAVAILRSAASSYQYGIEDVIAALERDAANPIIIIEDHENGYYVVGAGRIEGSIAVDSSPTGSIKAFLQQFRAQPIVRSKSRFGKKFVPYREKKAPKPAFVKQTRAEKYRKRQRLVYERQHIYAQANKELSAISDQLWRRDLSWEARLQLHVNEFIVSTPLPRQGIRNVQGALRQSLADVTPTMVRDYTYPTGTGERTVSQHAARIGTHSRIGVVYARELAKEIKKRGEGIIAYPRTRRRYALPGAQEDRITRERERAYALFRHVADIPADRPKRTKGQMPEGPVRGQVALGFTGKRKVAYRGSTRIGRLLRSMDAQELYRLSFAIPIAETAYYNKGPKSGLRKPRPTTAIKLPGTGLKKALKIRRVAIGQPLRPLRTAFIRPEARMSKKERGIERGIKMRLVSEIISQKSGRYVPTGNLPGFIKRARGAGHDLFALGKQADAQSFVAFHNSLSRLLKTTHQHLRGSYLEQIRPHLEDMKFLASDVKSAREAQQAFDANKGGSLSKKEMGALLRDVRETQALLEEPSSLSLMEKVLKIEEGIVEKIARENK